MDLELTIIHRLSGPIEAIGCDPEEVEAGLAPGLMLAALQCSKQAMEEGFQGRVRSKAVLS